MKKASLWKILENIKEIKFEHLERMQNQYSEKLSLHDFNEEIVTDKAPLNFRWIGFIKKYFQILK